MRRDFANPKLLALGIALTLAVVAGIEFLPTRTLMLMGPGGMAEPDLVRADDAPRDAVQWLDAQQHRLRCLYPRALGYMGCGLNLPLGGKDPGRGLDLTGFDTVELDIAYQGPSPFVRLGIRNFDPRFSKVEAPDTARFQSVDLRRRDIAAPVAVKLVELTVAEWWVHMYNLPRQYNRPSFENANSLLVELPAIQAGQAHELQVRRVTLKGPWVDRQRVYLGVLGAWLLGAALLAVHGWVQLRRSHGQQQREIDALTARTAQLRIEQDQLRRLATIDELTGVLNRRGLEQALGDFEQAAQGVTLVMLDIDHFKLINDRLGHDSGDEVLRRVAAVVAANLRGSDVLGRFGGEEFVIACQGTRLRAAARLAEKLRERVEHSEIHSAGVRVPVTASFGVALAPPGGSAAEALKRADEALYRAKGAGRNRVEIDASVQSDTATTLM